MQEFIPCTQRIVLDRLVEMGRAKFRAGWIQGLHVRPRIIPLLYGPTGAGKTFLARHAAQILEARFVKVEVANWIPVGARDCTFTVTEISNALSGDGNLVLLIDEIDKLVQVGHNWDRSIQAEVYAQLDLAVSTDRLLVIGAGTWQHEHGRRTPGFGHKERGVEFGGIPKELLHRFSHPMAVAYPSLAETKDIYIRTGIQKLADEVGVTLDPELHDWTGGMRSIERVCTDLVLQRKDNSEATLELLRSLIKPRSGSVPEGWRCPELAWVT